MGEAALYEAVRNNIPLVEVVVRFVEGIDYEDATTRLNALAEDFHLHPKPWYNDPGLRIGTATKEALHRMFAWDLKRAPLARYDESTSTWGHWPDIFCWEVVVPPSIYPIEGIFKSISMEQPGADDNGQWYE